MKTSSERHKGTKSTKSRTKVGKVRNKTKFGAKQGNNSEVEDGEIAKMTIFEASLEVKLSQTTGLL
eukprot:4333488-Pleurochrysis_carterae.AAC.1